MPLYQRQGDLPEKRHIAFRSPQGALYHEHLLGNMGFTGPSSLLYRLQPPTVVSEMKTLHSVALREEENPRLALRHFRTQGLEQTASPTLDRVPLLFNRECALLYVNASTPDDFFYRNGQADEYLYISAGQGTLHSEFGTLTFTTGEQLVIPRGVTYQLQFSDPLQMLVVESAGFLRTPKRYRNEFGQLLEGAPFSERAIKLPQLAPPVQTRGSQKLLVKQRDHLHQVTLEHHPFDVVGWDGYYFPWSFHINDFEPITGAIHQPPPVHQFLQGDALVICNFVPRPYDYHPQAIPAPYNHSNVMTDEVLFYASSQFMSRKGIEYGSMTLHPDGLTHGPHPGRYEDSIGKERTEELAVMVDTFAPLKVAQQGLTIEDNNYYKSWVAP